MGSDVTLSTKIGIVFFAALAAVAYSTTESAGELVFAGRTRFFATPKEGVRVNARAYYTRSTGNSLKSFHDFQSRSDTADVAFQRFSQDNGRNWSDPVTVVTQRKTVNGAVRSYPRIGYVDPNRDVLVEFSLNGILPNDDPLEGMKHWSLRYSLSHDGGHSSYHEGAVVQTGEQFTAKRPFPGVEIGKNSIMIGDQSCITITLADGNLLQPVQITPLGPNGEYYNPGGGYTYHDAAVLIGEWNDRGTVDWKLSQRVVGDPNRSTRGMIEPTVAELPDGRVLMVLRGSNHRKPGLPGHKWYSISKDGGETWSTPQPWRYNDGFAFYSPSSCSQLLKHSNGRVYWIGNISARNPNGILPRHPLVIGEVDSSSMRLVRETICTIDKRRDGDSDKLQISNVFAREDRETHDIVVHCSPLNRVSASDADNSSRVNWTAHAWLYRIAVTEEQ